LNHEGDPDARRRRTEGNRRMDTIPISTFSIADLGPGTKTRLFVHVFDELIRPITLPTLVAKGRQPGPTLLVVAGVHGDEYEGMEAIRRLFPELDPARMRGAFLAIPVANPFAYETRARITPLHLDGLNLARVFPGDAAGPPTRRLAAALLDLVERHVGPDDLFLDFHSGSADVPFATLIGFRDVAGPATARAEEAARRFGVPRLWRIPDGPGPFNAETARRGIPTLGTETTGRAGCDPTDVAAFAQGLRNLLAFLGVCPDWPVPPRLDGPARRSIDFLAPATGFLRLAHRLDDEVAAGDTLGSIVDLFGDPIADVAAPASGTLWAARSMPPVRVGELVAMIATDG
jgi:predicted deacylase